METKTVVNKYYNLGINEKKIDFTLKSYPIKKKDIVDIIKIKNIRLKDCIKEYFQIIYLTKTS